MDLTGKCKDDFKEWVRRTQDWENYYVEWDGFFELPLSMQWGVLVDFFGANGILVCDFFGEGYEIHSSKLYKNFCSKEYESRSETRTEAIKKANELYNNQ